MQASHATSSFFILGPTLLLAETYSSRYVEVNRSARALYGS